MTEKDCIHLLAKLTLGRGELQHAANHSLMRLGDADWAMLGEIAAEHHVSLRAFKSTHRQQVISAARVVVAERERGDRALAKLSEVCEALEQAACPCVVIKSLDHWPDMGSDLDILTCSPEQDVISVMEKHFGATVEAPSWSDRVAKKMNFRLPDLPELVEVHFGRLGQTGEHRKLAKRILQRRVVREIAGMKFFVPAPEEQILLTTLQRLYRHFYMRICDVLDTATLVDSGNVDFDELRRAAKRCSIWPGTATLLRLVSEYMSHYRGRPLQLPRRVWLASAFGTEKILPHDGFLRLPLFPQGAKLYARQVFRTVRRRDTAGSLRLGLIPPLAAAANVKYKLTGNAHGIW
jgi:Uncharacterised nucleotidyltransferase